MHTNDVKVFGKMKKEFEILIQTVKIYSQDRGMGFGKENCTILITTPSQIQMTEWIELLNQEKIGEKETYKY